MNPIDGQGSEPLAEWPARSRTSYKQMTHFEDLDRLSIPADEGKGSVSAYPRGGDQNKTKKRSRNLMLNDGVSRIDYILAWQVPTKESEFTDRARIAREKFQRNLIHIEGLVLECDLSHPDVHYCKIHAPWEVLARYAEILKFTMKMKQSLVAQDIQEKYSKWENPVKAVTTTMWSYINNMIDFLMTPFQQDPRILPKIEKEATLCFARDKDYLFDIPENKDLFFSNTERSRIVDFILRRTTFGEDKSEAYTFGIKKMLTDGYYSAAYPLHEGHWKADSANNARKLLYENWAHWKNFFKVQPIDYIRSYYGAKIGLYFAWLGFYTQFLVPPSIIGLIIFIYGVAYMVDSYPSKEICDSKLNITMCPMCDYKCPYWKLNETCADSEYSRMFDNNATVFFAVFMSFWGTLFLEFWKRKQAVIQYKWDLVDFVKEEEPPRPEYLAKLSNYPCMKVNAITNMKEPYLPFWTQKFPRYLISYGSMLFTMCLAIGGVVGVIAYRVSTLASLQLLDRGVLTNSTIDDTKHVITQNANIITSVTAACINLVVIIILNLIYGKVAIWLTDFECLRTQTEYDDSINIKLFSLQFVNYYSSIIYIAFFKGRLVGRPGAYNMAFGARQEECGSGGCLIELCIQLAIIMAGKQFIQNNLLEIVLPKSIKFLKRCYRKRILKQTAEEIAKMAAWEKDYQLDEHTSLYGEYLEMVLQFGFLTIFVAAFPLGPLCCLLNNVVEIRSDALKFLTDLRRPLAERAPDIGIWYEILYAISRLAIVSNAFIIALTSDFIPRLVYTYYYSDNHSLVGYTNWTLSYFNTSDFEPNKKMHFNQHVDICRYHDFRNPPWSEDKYEFSQSHWHILAARLAFVVVFENFIVVCTSLIAWLIPDMPAKVKNKIHREAYISHEIVIKTELEKAHGAADMDIIFGGIASRMRSMEMGNGSELKQRSEVKGSPDSAIVDEVSVSNI